MTYQAESFLGSGDLQVAVYDQSTGALGGERDIGNASNFVINAPSVERKELSGESGSNYHRPLASVILKTGQDLAFTLTDINRKNLALCMFGTESSYTQAGGNNTGSPESVTVYVGTWTKLAHRNIDSSGGNRPVITLDDVVLTEDVDYEIDYQVGRIMALADGAIQDGDILAVEYKWLAIEDGHRVQADQVNAIDVFLRLIGSDQADNREFEVIVHRAQLVPSGDLGWLSDEYAIIEFKGKIFPTDSGTWECYFYSI